MNLGLEGKTVIVTGGSGGIGRGIVLGFAAEGCKVMIAARDEAKSLEVAAACADFSGTVAFFKTDTTQLSQVEAMVAATRDRFGPIDVLVNNAGGGDNVPKTFEDKTQDELDYEVNLNIWNVVNCIRAVSKEMISRRSGSIINISSNAALVPAAANRLVNYAGAKGYIHSMSKGLAFEMGAHNVRVNCIAPGWIVPLQEDHVSSRSFWRTMGFKYFGTPDQMEEKAKRNELPSIEHQPLKRVGRPADIANLAVFLASDASSYITGQIVSVSGGAYMP